MKSLLTAEWTILILLELTADVLAVLICCIVLLLAISTLQSNDFYG